VTLDKGGETIPAELWAWDPAADLALLRIARGGLPQPAWATEARRAGVVGTRVYALSGLGGQGATVSPGTALDLSAAGIRHDVRMAPEFRGAPLTTADGMVLGVVSAAYSPTGVDPGELRFAPFVTAACQRLLRCPEPGSSAPATAAGRTATSAAPASTASTLKRN
jgi:S1-C subfamily serine protease